MGCGTGALSQIILEVASPGEVIDIDPSEGYIAYAREHIPEARARFLVGDAQALPVAGATYDAVAAGLVLNFVPDPTECSLKCDEWHERVAPWHPMCGTTQARCSSCATDSTTLIYCQNWFVVDVVECLYCGTDLVSHRSSFPI